MMWTARSALALVLTLALVSPVPTVFAQPAPDPARQVDSLYGRLDSTVAPGFAVALVRDGQLLLRRGFGYADLEHRVRITPSTVFDLASLSKQFAGLTVAMLAAEGRVNLDAEIGTYIPEMRALGTPITVRQLLHHTTGLRDWPGALSVAGWSFDDVIAFPQILRFAYAQRSLNFTPGAEYSYSNTGYNLLAEMVQRVTRRTFREYTTETLFRPLGMTRTAFRDNHAEVTDSVAFGYQRSPRGYLHTPNGLTALGSSSLFSNVDDLVKWLVNFDEMRVGGARAFALARTRGRLNSGDSIPYAFGISHGSYRGLANLNHTGSWASFRTYMVWYPAQRTGVVVLANGNGEVDPVATANRITDLYLRSELAAAAAASAVATAASPEPVAVPRATLDEYVGLYRLGPGWYTQITRAGDSLRSQATRESAAPMIARTTTEFWIPAYNGSMTFVRDAGGKVNALMYRGQRAPRVSAAEARTPAPPLAELVGRYESEELATFYDVALVDGALELRHFRRGRWPLQHVLGHEFGTENAFTRSVLFERDRSGRVSGILINGDARNRNVQFVRRR